MWAVQPLRCKMNKSHVALQNNISLTNRYHFIDVYTKHLPHLLRNFPVAARGENEASNKESIAEMFSEKYKNLSLKSYKE